jgi:Putative metal-binding motif
MRLVIALLAVGACMALPAAASAQFTSAEFRISVKGSGSAVVTGGLSSCARLDNLDDRVTVACPPFAAIGAAAPMVVTAIPNPSPSGHWRAVSCGGVPGPTCSFPPAGVHRVSVVFADDTAPTVVPGPPTFSATRERTVRFAGLRANEPATFECRTSAVAAFRPCTAATELTLGEGPNAVEFRGTDRSGNVGPPVPSATFQVLDTRLVSAPPPFSRSTAASFRVSTLAGFSFDCALDGAALADCGDKLADNILTETFSGLREGAHTFAIRARNGNDIDQVPVRYTWTVDTVEPNTELDPLTGPRDGEVSTLFTATFAMSASEPATIQCRLDGAGFAACPATRSFANLTFGQHQFQARAVDRAGNVDASPISRTWTVLAVDTDGDGFNQRSDCDDSDPLIRPGAREVAGNDSDENCDGFVAPPPRMSTTTVPNSWSVLGKRATITRLQVKRLRAGARVEIRCLGQKCAFKRVKAKGRAKRGTLNLLKSLSKKQRKLRAGQTLEIRITAPRVIGKVVRYKIRAGKIPRAQELCLPPGTRKPARCG